MRKRVDVSVYVTTCPLEGSGGMLPQENFGACAFRGALEALSLKSSLKLQGGGGQDLII